MQFGVRRENKAKKKGLILKSEGLSNLIDAIRFQIEISLIDQFKASISWFDRGSEGALRSERWIYLYP